MRRVREVSGDAVRSVLEVLDASGIDTQALVARLPISLDVLRTAARIDWEVFVTLVEGLELYRDRLSLEEIGARTVEAMSFHFLRRVGQFVISPRQLYTVAHRLAAPGMFSNITVTQQWLPSGRLVVTGELAPGYRESEAVFRLCNANIAALPRVLDLPPSTVEELVISGRRARLTLMPPRSHTLAVKLRRGARTMFAIGDAFRAVARQQEQLEGSLEAVRTSRHEQRQLIERLPDGVLLHRGGVICWANAAMLELLGYERLADVVGRNVLELMPADDRARIVAEMPAALLNQITDERREYRLLRRDGSIRWVQASAVQSVDHEGAPARLVVLRDVTEGRRLREQLALGDRMASLGRLAAGVAHEINNPLSYVHASLEVASRELAHVADARAAKIADSIARARDGADRVRGIVRDLNMLSRPDDEPFEAVDLPGVLDSTLALAANATRSKAKVIRAYGDAPRARATRGRLGQLFLNLVLNAADAVPEGNEDQHEIRITTRTDARGRAVVEIADTGAGIEPSLAPRIFDPFFTTKEVGAGTGLGLAICHRIVTQLGGEISFESVPGRGTTFTVALPASDDVPADVPVQPYVSRRARVLVVDDEPGLLHAIEELIGEAHDVMTANSGREAIDLLHRDDKFDVIVADLMMPGVTGMDLYERTRADHPGLEQRFVFMTGGAFTARSSSLVASVPNRCVAKPFDADELMRAIGDVIEQRVS